jgi:general nucleoside transport system ATP-binding protein
VLLISEDLDELFEVSDRLVVLFHGAVAAEFGPEDYRADVVGPLMVGVMEQSDAA